jgi:uncharacterized protein YycO
MTPLTYQTPLMIALHRGAGIVGTLIRWQTRSPYSHASLYCPGDGVIEAREGHGVRRLTNLDPKPGEKIDLYAVPSATAEQLRRAWTFAQIQVGDAYDWTMVLRFISRRQASRKDSGKWFCSELAFAAFHHAGLDLLARCQPWEISPGLLGKSPLLTFERCFTCQGAAPVEGGS